MRYRSKNFRKAVAGWSWALTGRCGASERSVTYDEEEYLARLPERLVLIFDGA
ncbi:MAG: hypothetical protein M3272_08020 [Actinomycetota bacterium]|nr:hypothetical protein [Actinomycetota bacterium]